MSDLLVYSVAPVVAEAVIKAVTLYLSKKKQEKSDTGKKSDKHVIEPVFGRYVTRNKGFRSELENIQELVQNYANRSKVNRPLNIFLAAAPGSGKSFLIKQLANSISSDTDVQFEEFHVVAFSTIDDLIGVFQRVQSANLKGKLPFVLFDEVDGKVDGRYILANFLAPMWDGVFHVGKESFFLGKAVFVFAASSMVPSPTIANVLNLDDDAADKDNLITYQDFADKWKQLAEDTIDKEGNQHIEKCKDFIDRIDKMLCIPPVHRALTGDDSAKEQIDIASILIWKHFKRVNRIEESALMTLVKKLSETSSRRLAEKCIFCSNLKDARTFAFSDLPKNDQDRYNADPNIKKLMGQYLSISISK